MVPIKTPLTRLTEALLGVALLAFATAVSGPVAATILTPGWVETADVRDWASMTFFLSIVAALLWVAWRLIVRRARPVRGVLRSRDWWVLAVLAVLATVCVAVASYWTIALPGLLPIAAAVAMARRRARLERIVLVDSDPSELPPRASFTTRQSS